MGVISLQYYKAIGRHLSRLSSSWIFNRCSHSATLLSSNWSTLRYSVVFSSAYVRLLRQSNVQSIETRCDLTVWTKKFYCRCDAAAVNRLRSLFHESSANVWRWNNLLAHSCTHTHTDLQNEIRDRVTRVWPVFIITNRPARILRSQQ